MTDVKKKVLEDLFDLISPYDQPELTELSQQDINDGNFFSEENYKEIELFLKKNDHIAMTVLLEAIKRDFNYHEMVFALESISKDLLEFYEAERYLFLKDMNDNKFKVFLRED